MVGSERVMIDMELATQTRSPAETLREIFREKANVICGGEEVHNEITKGKTVGLMRATNWAKVLKLAERFLEDMSAEIPALTAEVKRLEEALAKAEASEAIASAERGDLAPIVRKAISQPDTFVKSQCGFAITSVNREIRKENRKRKREARQGGTEPTLLAPLDVRCWEDTVAAFDEQLKGFLSPGKVRATSDVVQGACCEVVGCEADVDTPRSYCDELCTRLAGNPALNEVEFLGGAAKELRASLEQKAARLRDDVDAQRECASAKVAIEEFKSQMDALDAEVARTFDVQKNANRALNEAEEGLENLKDEFVDLEAKREEAEQRLSDKEAMRAGLARDLEKLKADEPGIRQELEAARVAFEEALKTANEAAVALISFDKLAGLVTSTVANMWMYFSDAVLTPLNNLGLEKGLSLDGWFEKNYEQSKGYRELLKGLSGLTKHCQKSAKPAFEKVKALELRATLLDMCEYDPAAESSTQFASTVLTIGDKILASLEAARAWHEPLRGHPELTDEKLAQLASAGEPAGLRNVENAFGPSSYFSGYLQRWKADSGDFLQLLASLTALLEQLKANAARLGQIKDDFAKRLEDHVALKKKAFGDLSAAIKSKEQSEEGARLAKAEEDARSDAIGQAESNLAHLKKLFDEAYAAYEAALKLFEDVHTKGTNMKF